MAKMKYIDNTLALQLYGTTETSWTAGYKSVQQIILSLFTKYEYTFQ